MKLYNVKGKYRWSDQGFSALLEVLSDMFPEKNNVSKLMYEAKKTMRLLGSDYEKIHACKNDCILLCKEYTYLNKCATCGESRWKNKKKTSKQVVTKCLQRYCGIFLIFLGSNVCFNRPKLSRT